jgi:hypothetical protein
MPARENRFSLREEEFIPWLLFTILTFLPGLDFIS